MTFLPLTALVLNAGSAPIQALMPAVMERAFELDVNFIDTADVYGNGHSETLVAKVLKGRRDGSLSPPRAA